MSFLRARSPVTPNITTTHGPADPGNAAVAGIAQRVDRVAQLLFGREHPRVGRRQPPGAGVRRTSIFGTSKFLCLRQPKTPAAKSEPDR